MRLMMVLLVVFFSCGLSGQTTADQNWLSNKEIETLFFGEDQRKAITHTEAPPWHAIGQMQTASGNLCTATLVASQIAITAGHCLFLPPDQTDYPVKLSFINRDTGWHEQIYDLTTQVSVDLPYQLKPEGRGWIIPANAAARDYAFILLDRPPADVTPLPLFTGSRQDLTAKIKAGGRKVTHAGYPGDYPQQLYAHYDCQVTGWAQREILSHQCDTLPGDSGSPLLLKTEQGWQLIGLQSSAPSPDDRSLADNQAIAVTAFRDELTRLIKHSTGTDIAKQEFNTE